MVTIRRKLDKANASAVQKATAAEEQTVSQFLVSQAHPNLKVITVTTATSAMTVMGATIKTKAVKISVTSVPLVIIVPKGPHALSRVLLEPITTAGECLAVTHAAALPHALGAPLVEFVRPAPASIAQRLHAS